MDNYHALYDEADRLKDDGKLPEAEAKLREVLALAPTYALAHSALAVILGRLGRHEEAVEHAKQVAELEPKDAFSFTALSVTYQRAYAGTGNYAFIPLAEQAMDTARRIQQG